MQLMFIMGAVFAACMSNIWTAQIPACKNNVESHESKATTAAPAPFEEPLCENKTCKSYETCMIREKCTAPESCILEPFCTYIELPRGPNKTCEVGNPIIHKTFHGYAGYRCWKREHCPTGFICSSRNLCCRPPRPDVKSGACPEMDEEPLAYGSPVPPCKSQCQSDADCAGEQKCCQTAAHCPKKQCTYPDTGELGWYCTLMICSFKYHCRRGILGSCTRKLDASYRPELIRLFDQGR